MKYVLDHTALGFCWWDLLAIIALVVLFFYCRKKIKDMLQQKDELESQLSAQNAEMAYVKEEAKPAPEPLAVEDAPQQE